MLDAYLNMEYAGNSWFEDLNVSKTRPDDPLKNNFPVVHLDMKDLNMRDYDGFLNSLRKKIATLYSRHDYLGNSSGLKEPYPTRYERILMERSDEDDLVNSILYLCEMLETYHGRKAVILIDEYDSPLNSSYGTQTHGSILDFMKRFYSAALKGGAGAFAVVTGVMQLSKESVFSGLNNLMVNNIFKAESNEMFGFTTEEVKRLCADCGHPEKFEEARQWYDGYRFGNADIYNPWSVLNYVRSGFEPDMYWAGTSGNSIIPILLDRADRTVYENLRALGSKQAIERQIDQTISYAEMDDVDGIYVVMALSGYLKAVSTGRNYSLSIPNDEMFVVFAKMVTDRLDSRLALALDSFCESLLDNDAEGVAKGMSALITEVLSSRVLDHEHVYQAFTAGMLLSLRGRYEMFADGEKGKGFYDILLRSRRGDRPHIIIEFKRVRPNARDETLQKASQAALSQIIDREYFRGLDGEVLMYGVAVRGKDAAVASERRSL